MTEQEKNDQIFKALTRAGKSAEAADVLAVAKALEANYSIQDVSDEVLETRIEIEASK
jgi:hypothetical protein